MAIFPKFVMPDVGRVVSGAIRSADIATGGAVGQISKRVGFEQGENSSSRLRNDDALPASFKPPRQGSPSLPQWGGLNPNLIGNLYACDSKGVQVGEETVAGPITDGNFEATLNWQSPFENTGPESKAPALMALLQTGQIAVIANALQAVIPEDSALGRFAGGLAEDTQRWAKDLEGRTGITKLNSRQVFAGMPPIRVTVTMHFRALDDPLTQVEAPYRRILEWALPRHLAENGVLAEVIAGKDGFIKSLFPSIAPYMVGLRYGRQRYSPMVIEAVGNPIDGPITDSGIPIYRAVNLTLATLTALDRTDVAKMFPGVMR